MFGNDVHGDFCEIEIFADTNSGGNTSVSQNILNDGASELMGGHLIGLKITGNIKEGLIDRINMNISGSKILRIDTKNRGAYVNIFLHSGRGDNKRAPRYFFIDLKKTITAANAKSFEGGRNGKADSFVGASNIGNH